MGFKSIKKAFWKGKRLKIVRKNVNVDPLMQNIFLSHFMATPCEKRHPNIMGIIRPCSEMVSKNGKKLSDE